MLIRPWLLLLILFPIAGCIEPQAPSTSGAFRVFSATYEGNDARFVVSLDGARDVADARMVPRQAYVLDVLGEDLTGDGPSTPFRFYLDAAARVIAVDYLCPGKLPSCPVARDWAREGQPAPLGIGASHWLGAEFLVLAGNRVNFSVAGADPQRVAFDGSVPSVDRTLGGPTAWEIGPATGGLVPEWVRLGADQPKLIRTALQWGPILPAISAMEFQLDSPVSRTAIYLHEPGEGRPIAPSPFGLEDAREAIRAHDSALAARLEDGCLTLARHDPAIGSVTYPAPVVGNLVDQHSHAFVFWFHASAAADPEAVTVEYSYTNATGWQSQVSVATFAGESTCQASRPAPQFVTDLAAYAEAARAWVEPLGDRYVGIALGYQTVTLAPHATHRQGAIYAASFYPEGAGDASYVHYMHWSPVAGVMQMAFFPPRTFEKMDAGDGPEILAGS